MIEAAFRWTETACRDRESALYAPGNFAFR